MKCKDDVVVGTHPEDIASYFSSVQQVIKPT